MINGQLIQAENGELLSRVLQENCNFKMPCAGQGHCGKCKVYAKGELSEPDAVEKRLLTAEELAKGIRLACRTRILGEAAVSWEQQGRSQILLGEQAKVTGKKRLFQKLGAAVDIGTTTLALQLYDESGLIAQTGCDNPQGRFGADVISRIERSMEGERHALAQAVRQGINDLLIRASQTGGCDPAQIDTMVVTGNTSMLYLLTERDPQALSQAPFQADWLAGEWVEGEALDLICSRARVWLPPCISAFVGADITTALLAVDILKGENNRLLVDIGTNGEMVLWKDGRLSCCATAAGPAFEGAGLSMGMQGEEGAISHVTWAEPEGNARHTVCEGFGEAAGHGVWEGPGEATGHAACTAAQSSFRVEVIGGGAPRGICGSGVIDAVYCLLKSGRLDETGYLEEETAVIGGEVTMNQEDIRKIQLAKSAICAGMETLLEREKISAEQLDELLVAGGFGSFLNLESARGIGLLPKAEPKKTTVCGNAALAGAAKILWAAEEVEEAARIVNAAKPLNLAADQIFFDKYMEGMFF